MTSRRAFVKLAALLGVGTALGACGTSEEAGAAGRRVVIVGAGAAGMSAGYLLSRAGADVTILEASSSHGGRIATLSGFVDFPIPLGGEWVHTDEGVLDRIVDDETVDVQVTLVPYRSNDEAGFYDGDELTLAQLGEYSDLKFVGETWLTFFDRFVVPEIADRLFVDVPVASIDYSSDGIVVTDRSRVAYEADQVIVTVPIQVLKDRDIEFLPELPEAKLEAIDEAFVWGGMKIFVEFSERFYPTFLATEGAYSRDGQKDWYDAAHGQDTDAHVLGLFAVGDQAEPYQALDGDELRDFFLAELDAIFDGAASRSYIKHVSQNWNEEPFIRQAYFADDGNWQHPPAMRRAVENRVFFAGDGYTDGNDWSSVHMAAISAKEAVDAILEL